MVTIVPYSGLLSPMGQHFRDSAYFVPKEEIPELVEVARSKRILRQKKKRKVPEDHITREEYEKEESRE
ncbi:unnamed protein product, partial [Symbiodinium microadriaticum]